MLFFVATPIGNLEDLSKRAAQTLASVDYIFCEDTRHSKILLDHYAITRPLVSYHKFNEKKREEKILGLLKEGKKVALITDAGTPCLSDPGAELTRACIREKIPFTAMPGACSPIQALILSGFAGDNFQFVGFFPRKGKKELRKILFYPGVTIALESAKRLHTTLEAIAAIDPNRQIAIAKEMTKKFEECIRGRCQDLALGIEKEPLKGEIVLCIAPGTFSDEELTIGECIELLRSYHGLSLKEAIKEAASFLRASKKEIYTHMLT